MDEEQERELWELRSAAIDRDRLKGELQALQEQNGRLERDLENETKERASWQAAHTNMRAIYDVVEQALAERSAEVTRLQQEVAKQQATISRMYKFQAQEDYQRYLYDTYNLKVAQMPTQRPIQHNRRLSG